MRIRGTAARHGAVWNNTVRLSGTHDTAQTTNRVSRAYDIRFLSLGNPTGISIVSSAEPSGRPYKIRSRRRDGHSFSRHVVLAPVRPCGATVGRQRGRVSKFHGSPSRNPSHDECPPPPPIVRLKRLSRRRNSGRPFRLCLLGSSTRLRSHASKRYMRSMSVTNFYNSPDPWL